MKKFLLGVLLSLGLIAHLILTTPLVSAQSFVEKIRAFQTDITVRTDGYIDVQETIQYDFGADQRHGIYRTIPLIKENKEGKKFTMDVDVHAVTDTAGTAYEYTDSVGDGELTLKIGDPDVTVTGEHTYVIDYTVGGAMTYFSDHDELYWNVNGFEWTVPIDSVAVSVVLPKGSAETALLHRCFVGAYGSTEESCVISADDTEIGFLSTRELTSGENLSFVINMKKGVVSVLEPTPVVNFFDTFLGKITLGGLFIAGFLWYIVYPLWLPIKWWWWGRDPKLGADPTAYFDPPTLSSGRALTPAESGGLIDETVDLRDISATLVDLARRGYMHIDEVKKGDLYLRRKQGAPSDDILADFEALLLKDIFKKGEEVRVKDVKLYATVQEAEKMVYEGLVREKFFPTNPKSTRTYYTVIGSLALFTFNIALALMCFLFGRAIPRKTLSGATLAQKARSLKNFLKSQERQLEFEAKQSVNPAQKQALFEKLLPYAVAFGVEKIWAKRFAEVHLKAPEWFHTYRSGTFNSLLLTDSLNSSFSTFRSSATPTTSSSGFSSGSGGGGFSGGGGGGGGGGSW